MARVSVIAYRETIWSELFPGNRHTIQCFQPAVLAAENALALTPAQRKRTVWRMDGGSGSDEQLVWLLARGYQVLAKGYSNRRAAALAKQVTRWDAYRADTWVGEVEPPADYGRSVRVFVQRRLKNGAFCHSYYVSSLALASKALYLNGYDARGAAEIEQFRNDKSGLSLAARRKQSLFGQTGYILLTDLAHNLLADFYYRALCGSKFESYGPKRIVRDLLALPGRLVFAHDQLVRVELLSQNQIAKDLRMCLVKYCASA